MTHQGQQIQATDPIAHNIERDPTNGQATIGAERACRSGLCSIGLMRSFCPTCLLLGLVLLPFELAGKGVRRLIATG